MRRNNSVIVFILFFVSPHTPAHTQLNSKKFEFGAGLAAFVYQGDLTPNRFGSFVNMRPGLVLSAAKILNASFLVRGSLSIGGLKGNETKYNNPEYRKFRAFTFRTPLIEFAPQLVWNPLAKNSAVKGFSPYLFGGAGLAYIKPKKDYTGFDANYFGDGSDIPAQLAQDEEQQLPALRVVVPLGAGLRYNLSERFAINAEASYRIPFTDYIDGYSRSVNPEQKDHYHSTMIGLIYRTGNNGKQGCPVIRY
jgi:hypothetical protein